MPTLSTVDLYNRAQLKEQIKRTVALIADRDKEYRKTNGVCQCCHYIRSGGIVMQAFTDSDCEECGITMTFPNSAVDKLCKACGPDKKRCRTCGGSLSVTLSKEIIPSLSIAIDEMHS
jgi:hypothetical protein